MQLRERALALAPEKNPALWTIINGVLFLWSAVLVYEIVATEGPLERPYGEHLYLIWNFGSTVMWCCEIGLHVWYHYPLFSWLDGLQLVVAFYFLFDSILLFARWANPEKEIDDELVDVGITSLAYLAILIYTANLWRQKARGEQVETEDEQETSFVNMDTREVI